MTSDLEFVSDEEREEYAAWTKKIDQLAPKDKESFDRLSGSLTALMRAAKQHPEKFTGEINMILSDIHRALLSVDLERIRRWDETFMAVEAVLQDLVGGSTRH